MSTHPPPLIEIAIEPRTPADRERLGRALATLAAEDADFLVTVDHESGQTIIKGISEEHVEASVARITREFGAACRVGAPQVAYRETISGTSDIDYTHKKLTGGSGQFARVKIRFEPLARGAGFQFENAVVGGTVPDGYVPGVEKGLRASLESGVLAGFPVIDFKATLYDGAYHDVDSSALAFEIAARAAFKEGLRKAGPVLLEPVMRVEVVTPREYMGDVISDLNSRRGRITAQAHRADRELVRAEVPLSNLFGYAPVLQSMSRGRATHTMSFSHYASVPAAVFDPDPPFRPAMGMRA